MFKGKIVLTKVDANNYELTENISFTNFEYEINVLKGFETDGASIPRFLWGVIGSPFNGNYTEAAIIHNALYKAEALPRYECDDLFLTIMKELNVSFLQRYAMYYAVKFAGGLAWKQHEKVEVRLAKKYIKIVRE